jgi:hypothetical protein
MPVDAVGPVSLTDEFSYLELGEEEFLAEVGCERESGMLVATRSFTYMDPYVGEQEVREGITRVSADHELAERFSDDFAPADSAPASKVRPAQLLAFARLLAEAKLPALAQFLARRQVLSQARVLAQAQRLAQLRAYGHEVRVRVPFRRALAHRHRLLSRPAPLRMRLPRRAPRDRAHSPRRRRGSLCRAPGRKPPKPDEHAVAAPRGAA